MKSAAVFHLLIQCVQLHDSMIPSFRPLDGTPADFNLLILGYFCSAIFLQHDKGMKQKH